MNTIVILVISLLLVIAAGIFLQKRSQRRRYQDPAYLEHLQRIPDFFEAIKALENLDDYITWVQRDKLKERFAPLSSFFRGKTGYYEKEEAVGRFNFLYEDIDSLVARHNRDYVKSQKDRLAHYFDNIEGKQLDDQQRLAVITDEYSNLIIAGAGSGKTLTILGKVKYLIEQKSIHPEDILLLSFTQKTVEELNERLRKIQLGTTATTFHKLGYGIIKKFHVTIPAVTNENTLSAIINEFFKTEIFENPAALQAYIQYIACYMNIPEEYETYGSLGEKLDTEKGIDFQTLQGKCESLNIVAKGRHDTMQGERVKSVEELMIANFLYLNGIEYEYEKPYPFGDVLYRPDFFLKDYNIYIEHFGVDENGRAKWLTHFHEQQYIADMKVKREAHKQYNTRLLETYSYFNRDNVLLEKLEQILKAENVAFRPRDARSIYEKVVERDRNFGKEINKLVESFINLAKSRRLAPETLTALFWEKMKSGNRFMRERQQMFLQFAVPILEKYDRILQERNEIDFNDMINKASELLQANKPAYSYKYIIVDEYQDISYARFSLIKEIRELSGARLVCVGDDWQSIYRFAGSDISLFSNFGNYVGPYEQLLIEQTYRNSQSLIDVTLKFIQKNPKQISKSPKSRKPPVEDPLKFVHFKEERVEDAFLNELQYLVEKYGKMSILVLGRHSFDINDLVKLTPNSRVKYFERTGKLEVKGFEEVDIKYMTVHKSKGTEADNVIVLNLKNHLLGFPNKMTDDPILSLLLNDAEEFRFAEERRLFYVALTRTKNEVVLLVPGEASLFAEELMTVSKYLFTASQGTVKTTNCPYCKTGKLVIRKNTLDVNQFLGCSHYPACSETFKDIQILENSYLCPACKSGFMTKRAGKYGSFLGCTNYPDCKCTIDLQNAPVS